MTNKPKYNLFKNTKYALCGLKEMVSNERSFQIELILFIILIPFVFLMEIEGLYRLIMFLSLVGVLIAETINSAIERVVELVTSQTHPLAKQAKDIGSTIVFFSICNLIIIWGYFLLWI